MMGIRMRRPRPSTLLWRSLEGGFLTTRAPFEEGWFLGVSMAAPLETPLVLPESEFDMKKKMQTSVLCSEIEAGEEMTEEGLEGGSNGCHGRW